VASGIYPSDSEYKNRVIVTMQFRVQIHRVKCLAKWNKSFSFFATRLNFIKNSETEVLDDSLKVDHPALMTAV